MPPRKSQRRQQILEALAQMLEANPGNRITTAGLARQVGVSEAALYRHFPSKSKMFEGLIEFIEETLFSRVNIILNEEQAAAAGLEMSRRTAVAFAEIFRSRRPLPPLAGGEGFGGTRPAATELSRVAGEHVVGEDRAALLPLHRVTGVDADGARRVEEDVADLDEEGQRGQWQERLGREREARLPGHR